MGREVLRKSFVWPAEFNARLSERRLSWHLESPSRLKDLGGIATQNAFVLALLQVALEAIEEPHSSDRLWEVLAKGHAKADKTAPESPTGPPEQVPRFDT